MHKRWVNYLLAHLFNFFSLMKRLSELPLLLAHLCFFNIEVSPGSMLLISFPFCVYAQSVVAEGRSQSARFCFRFLRVKWNLNLSFLLSLYMSRVRGCWKVNDTMQVTVHCHYMFIQKEQGIHDLIQYRPTWLP